MGAAGRGGPGAPRPHASGLGRDHVPVPDLVLSRLAPRLRLARITSRSTSMPSRNANAITTINGVWPVATSQWTFTPSRLSRANAVITAPSTAAEISRARWRRSAGVLPGACFPALDPGAGVSPSKSVPSLLTSSEGTPVRLSHSSSGPCHPGRPRKSTRRTTMQPRIENPALTVPGAMPALQRLGNAVKKGGLPETTLYLIELRASQINGCAVCADMHSRELKAAGESDERIFTLAA